MTISSASNRNQYTANGINDTFAYGFKIFDEDDVLVYIDDEEQSTGYSVTGVESASGGNVVFSSAPDADAIITLTLDEPLTQGITYVNGDDFPAASHEEGLDRSVSRDLKLQEQLDRAIKLAIYTEQDPPSLADLEDGELLVYNSDDGTIESSGVTADDIIDMTDAAANAASAAASASSASSSASSASTSASAASTSATTASTAATAAAATLYTTSSTSNAIGTGSKTFTVEASKNFVFGQSIKVVDTASAANYMFGNVTSYSGTTLIINVTATGGSGTKTAWTISVAGIAGTDGAGAGSVTQVSVASSNGFAGTVATDTTTPAITISTSVTGIMKGNGTAASAASAGTDYYAPSSTDVAVADGGTGRSSHTAYAVVCGGTTTTAAQQSIVSVGTSGQVLTSNGAGNLPTFQTTSSAGAKILLSAQTASASAQLDFTSLITSTYDVYVFEILDIKPATDNTVLFFRTSTDNTNFAVTASDYLWRAKRGKIADSGTIAEEVVEQSSGATGIALSGDDGIGNATAEGISGTLKLYQPLGTTRRKMVRFEGEYDDNGTVQYYSEVTGFRDAIADIDAVRFKFSSGNIASGKIIMYGIKNS